jgi:hypothetical protein
MIIRSTYSRKDGKLIDQVEIESTQRPDYTALCNMILDYMEKDESFRKELN